MNLDASTACVVSALVVVLASLYAQHRAHELVTSTLERRIASLEHLHDKFEDGTWVRTNRTAADDGDDRLVEALGTMENAAQVRHLRELLVLAPYTHSGDPGYSFTRAKQAGFTFEQVFQAADDQNCPPTKCLHTLKMAGYAEVCTTYAGFTVEQMRPFCTSEEIATVLEQFRAGIDKIDERFSFVYAREAGFSLEEMKLAGYTCADALAMLKLVDTSSKKDVDSVKVDGRLKDVDRPTDLDAFTWFVLDHGRSFCSSDELDEVMRDLNAHGVAVDTLIDTLILAGYTPEGLRRSKMFTMEETNNGLYRQEKRIRKTSPDGEPYAVA